MRESSRIEDHRYRLLHRFVEPTDEDCFIITLTDLHSQIEFFGASFDEVTELSIIEVAIEPMFTSSELAEIRTIEDEDLFH